ncbi:MAG: hypothetical protein WCW03_02265 [Candidatus Paceibacterota bacterium]|jgi:hypothetical protein
MDNNQKVKDVFVTLAIGKKYLDNFNREFRGSFEMFAERHNLEFVVVDEFIKQSDKRAPWQKLLIFDHPRVAPYNRVMFMDADIYITKHAHNPFDVVGNKPWGIVDNNVYNLDFLKKTDPDLYKFCPKENRPDKLINSGVFIVTKEIKPIMEMIYNDYPEQQCCDNGPLSYHLLNDGRGILMPAEFNTVVFCYRYAYGWGLSKILKMYHENSFIHFAGNKGMMLLPMIRYIDTHEKTFLKSIIYFLGKESFDPITAFLFDWFGKIQAAYRYHINRRFIKK